ncbi:uncharacterized protein LOC130743058 [Lotus japonicus]|uniref:uncharacterized protein LOC130743058 n=1 Tax=Lotus japonicus TaxID=34305 RepID=UPI0025876FBC|nr:uncharacterized protein LOC130743058 [Lotus japonicus]
MMMTWCDHCCRETLTRFEVIVMSCDYCGKILADLYPQYQNPRTTRRGEETEHGKKLKISEEDKASNSMSSHIKECRQETCSETGYTSENKNCVQQISLLIAASENK